MKSLHRREFLKNPLAAATGLAFAPTIIPASALGRGGAVPPSERIVLGGIGLGSRGSTDLHAMLPEPDVQFLAVCDPQKRAARGGEEARGRALWQHR
jgi:hypothetical protein